MQFPMQFQPPVSLHELSMQFRCRESMHALDADTVSWIVNIVLLLAKAYAWYLSGSKAVLAALVDSFVDLVSRVVVPVIGRWMPLCLFCIPGCISTHSQRYSFFASSHERGPMRSCG